MVPMAPWHPGDSPARGSLGLAMKAFSSKPPTRPLDLALVGLGLRHPFPLLPISAFTLWVQGLQCYRPELKVQEPSFLPRADRAVPGVLTPAGLLAPVTPGVRARPGFDATSHTSPEHPRGLLQGRSLHLDSVYCQEPEFLTHVFHVPSFIFSLFRLSLGPLQESGITASVLW